MFTMKQVEILAELCATSTRDNVPTLANSDGNLCISYGYAHWYIILPDGEWMEYHYSEMVGRGKAA